MVIVRVMSNVTVAEFAVKLAMPGSGVRCSGSASMTKTENVDIEQMSAKYDTPEWKLRVEEDERFMREVVYAGLTNLNDGFDSPLIGHFSPKDFLALIDRCESRHIRIIGIEVFKIIRVRQPSKVMFLTVETSSEQGYKWARRLVQKYLRQRRITVSATFEVPRPLPA